MAGRLARAAALVRVMLGHHSWDFTASTYLHLNDDDLPETDFLDALDGRQLVGLCETIGETSSV